MHWEEWQQEARSRKPQLPVILGSRRLNLPTMNEPVILSAQRSYEKLLRGTLHSVRTLISTTVYSASTLNRGLLLGLAKGDNLLVIQCISSIVCARYPSRRPQYHGYKDLHGKHEVRKNQVFSPYATAAVRLFVAFPLGEAVFFFSRYMWGRKASRTDPTSPSKHKSPVPVRRAKTSRAPPHGFDFRHSTAQGLDRS